VVTYSCLSFFHSIRTAPQQGMLRAVFPSVTGLRHYLSSIP
jgi:hypothetical protein